MPLLQMFAILDISWTYNFHFFQYPDHAQSQIEDGYRKEITLLFSHFLIHCLYSCCGSLAFTVICCIVFTAVVDPWPLQLFAALSLQLLWILGLYSYLLHCLYSCCGSLVFTVICCIVFTAVVDPWFLQLFAALSLQLLWILGFYSYLLHCLYSCCGSLAFTVICCIVFTAVVDPWFVQLFADPLPL